MLQQWVHVIKSRSSSQCVEKAGETGLFIFAFGMLFKKSIAHFGILLMTLSFGLSLKDMGKEVWRDRLLLLSIAFFVFLMLRTIFASIEFPDHKQLLIEGALKLFGAGFFLTYVTAFWMHKARNKWGEILLVFMMGFIVQIMRQMDWGNLIGKMHAILTGAERATFGFATNRLGLFSALLLLACLLLYRPMWGSPVSGRAWYAARIAFWALISCLSAGCLIYSQSRSAWLAAILVIPAALAFEVFVSRGSKVRRLVPVLLIAVLIGGGFFTSNVANILKQRLAPGIDAPSVSARLSLYEIAWDNWKKHPIVGRGPGTSRLMIQQAGEEYEAVKRYDHLHNVFFDMAAQIGIVGIAFVGFSWFLIIRQTTHSKSLESIDKKYVLFALGALAMMLGTGIVNQPFHSPHGVYLVGYLGGICYTFKFADVSLQRLSISD